MSGNRSSLRRGGVGREFDERNHRVPGVLQKSRIAAQLFDRAWRLEARRAIRIDPVFSSKCQHISGLLQGFVESVAAGDYAGKIGKRYAVQPSDSLWTNATYCGTAVSYTRSTKLSTTFFSPAFSNAIVSLLPSIFTTLP